MNDAVQMHGAFSALCTIARLHQVAADPEVLAHQLGLSSSDAFHIDDLLRAAKQLGLKAKLSESTPERLPLSPLPALALLRDGSVVVLAQCDGQRVLLQPGGNARPVIESVDAFAAQWTGQLILITSRASLVGELAKFDFSWFIPSLVKYRKLLGEVLFISFMLQLFALVSPLFFQVVMDKVLVHRGVTTLDVLVIGLVVIVLFESLLNGLRAYVFSHTTSRIDVELGARLFRHLVQLPLAYFQARRVGDSVARVRELENIRSFLTGNALTVVLDVLFSGVFIGVMLFYSVTLTLIVLVSLPLYFGLSLAVVPILRKRLDVKFARGAENQAMLVETVTGIQTVKATALEPAFARRWDNQLAAYVSASFKTQNLATWAHEGVTLPMAKAREDDFKKLVDQGFMSGHATQDKTRERVELERDLATQQARLVEARSALAASTQSKVSWQAETRRTLQDRQAQARSRYLQLAQDEAKATQRERLTQLTAPVDGVVQQLAVHTLGGVVTEAQALMVIVPDEAQVTAEVTLENKDIGFVSEGQSASIKLETFSYTRYGAVPATVKWVTPDAVNDEKRGAIFPVTLVLNQGRINVDGKWVRLSPGMSLTAEIKTGQRRVIEYLLSPIQKAGQESLRER